MYQRGCHRYMAHVVMWSPQAVHSAEKDKDIADLLSTFDASAEGGSPVVKHHIFRSNERPMQ
jgi:hypothetical protein